MKDWKGNSKSTFSTLGATSHSENEREKDDYYATSPIAVHELMKVEKFSKTIWEPAVGGGHIADVLKEYGYNVICSDIVDRGYPGTVIKNFFEYSQNDNDIITNPPYKWAAEFTEHALDISSGGVKVALLLRVQFLESMQRWELFKKYMPVRIYAFSKRVSCCIGGDFSNDKGAVMYCWFIWEKGKREQPVIDWLNTGEEQEDSLQMRF